MKFYKCMHCGQIIAVLKETGVPVVCCGDNMVELVPGTSDGALEKHVPQFVIDGKNVRVTVGEVEHPMIDAHYIEWVIVETTKGFQQKNLKPGEKPSAKFTLSDDEEFVAVYELCNLHGLWKNQK